MSDLALKQLCLGSDVYIVFLFKNFPSSNLYLALAYKSRLVYILIAAVNNVAPF